MTSRLLQKLRDTGGFMLAEQLLSVVFLGALCLIISVGLGAAMNAYAAVSETVASQSLTNDAIARINDELEFAQDPEGAAGATFVSPSLHRRVQLVDNENAIVLMPVGSTTPLATLVPPTNNLIATVTNLTYVSGVLADDGAPKNGTWTYTVEIRHLGANSNSASLKTTSMTCARIGNGYGV